jgi:tRNA (Thr-GGU) A37 N-methylase
MPRTANARHAVTRRRAPKARLTLATGYEQKQLHGPTNGVIRSSLASLETAPLQGDEGAPEAWLELTASVAQGLVGITVGDELIVLTWLHRARRDVLQVHPRGRLEAPLTGVFATRSPDRPNPVGLKIRKFKAVLQRKPAGPLC